MLSKKEIKDIQSLNQKKYRSELKLFLAEGPKVVGELCRLMPSRLKMIYATPSWLDQQRADIKKLAVTEVSESELERISQLQTPNEVLAVFQQATSELLASDGLVVYLDRIRDPGNLGTIIRTADWFGIRNVVCSPECAELYNPKVVQSTMGSLARVSVSYDEHSVWLKQSGMPIWAATLDGGGFPVERTRGVLVIGNESQGINEEILQLASHRVTVPRQNNHASDKWEVESLNAAVAAGILMSQLVS